MFLVLKMTSIRLLKFSRFFYLISNYIVSFSLFDKNQYVL